MPAPGDIPSFDTSGTPLRLFMMIDSLGTGGSERQFALLTSALRPGPVALHLACLQRRGKFLEIVGEIEEFPLGGSFLTRQALRSLARLRHQLRQTHIEIAQSFDFYTNLFLIPAARLAGVPVVVASQRQLGDLLTPTKRRVQNLMFHLADCVVCNSQAAADRLASEGLPRRKLAVIPNGLPPEAFIETQPALPIESGTMRVGMIARMNERSKNQALFLRAAAHVSKRFPLAQFVIVGDGPFRSECEQLAGELGIASRTLFLGDRHDIQSVLASLDAVVSASRTESLSNAILEAMAAGRPVIATRVGGNPELVRERKTGLLIDPDDENALAAALESILAAPALAQEWGVNARRVARENYAMKKAAERFEQLYRSLLAKKGSRQERNSAAS